jgi:glycosyl transferase, family 25
MIAAQFIAAHGPLVLINLPNRTDRKSEFAAQLRRIGLSLDDPGIEVFPAIRPTDLAGFPTLGTRGCYLSHMAVLERAMEVGDSSVIICEDDCDFAPDFLMRLPAVMKVLAKTEWDIFYGGYTSQQVGRVVDTEANIFALPFDHAILCAHFYVIRGAAIGDFVAYLRAILARPTGHPEGGPMHYDGALNRFRADRPDVVTLAILPTLATQRSSRTDIHALRWFDRMPVVRDAVQMLRKVRR